MERNLQLGTLGTIQGLNWEAVWVEFHLPHLRYQRSKTRTRRRTSRHLTTTTKTGRKAPADGGPVVSDADGVSHLTYVHQDPLGFHLGLPTVRSAER